MNTSNQDPLAAENIPLANAIYLQENQVIKQADCALTLKQAFAKQWRKIQRLSESDAQFALLAHRFDEISQHIASCERQGQCLSDSPLSELKQQRDQIKDELNDWLELQ